eukprot:CAMPEP_0183438050 /NCGR_PEP_ID=MMETSP0370-20130417/75856_1 /TAXON_ID=268820 /ORGANISM="Peridinium aciculiferum, Strain PAER-2" /LENGTH=75 /DNA_ID=CAMNT_0025626115 /DNA_START=103 /DNA_END=327 /DNA_ORIENTATION=+
MRDKNAESGRKHQHLHANAKRKLYTTTRASLVLALHAARLTKVMPRTFARGVPSARFSADHVKASHLPLPLPLPL